MSQEKLKTEIQFWLKTIFQKNDVIDVSSKITGNSGKGDGYLGDILFVEATLNTKNKKPKVIHLVLKCSKRSQALRDSTGVKEAFQNEIYFFDTVLPEFTKFCQEKNTEVFDFIPTHYRSFVKENSEVIVLKNMKKEGFELWDRKQPQTRQHIDLIMEKFGKFHATSVAIKDQKPGLIEDISSKLKPIPKIFFEKSNMLTVFESKIDLCAEVLKDELDESILRKWKLLKKDVKYIFIEMFINVKGLKVIIHGDGWNNNFLFKYHPENGKLTPDEVAILDWQICYYTTPIIDISHFLFTCMSEKDFDDLNIILEKYYNSFTTQLTKLGTQPEKFYSYETFLEDWKKYSKYGILLSSLMLFGCVTDPDDVIDVSEIADKGEDYSKIFEYDLKDTTLYKNRMKVVVQNAVKNNLI